MLGSEKGNNGNNSLKDCCELENVLTEVKNNNKKHNPELRLIKLRKV